jgi:hypothetical protein
MIRQVDVHWVTLGTLEARPVRARPELPPADRPADDAARARRARHSLTGGSITPLPRGLRGSVEPAL